MEPLQSMFFQSLWFFNYNTSVINIINHVAAHKIVKSKKFSSANTDREKNTRTLDMTCSFKCVCLGILEGLCPRSLKSPPKPISKLPCYLDIRHYPTPKRVLRKFTEVRFCRKKNHRTKILRS